MSNVDFAVGDDLSDLFGSAPRAALPADPQLTRIRATVPEMHTETCPSCSSTGYFTSYSGRVVGKCFKCKGAGKRTFKTSAETRAKTREQAASRAANSKARNWEAFVAAHPDAALWIERKTPSFDFAYSMRQAVEKYGELTERQMATVTRLMEGDAARDAQRAAAVANAPRESIDVSRIVAAFNAAKAAGLKRIRLQISGVEFSRAPDSGKNPGAIYVKIDGVYCGKIFDGEFAPVSAFSNAQDGMERMRNIAADPAAAAKLHGLETGNCSCCGRLLTDPNSVALGIGPICAGKFSF